MIYRSTIAVLFALALQSALAQQPVEFRPDLLKLEWELVENQYQGAEQTLSRLTLTNDSKNRLPVSGWSIYFSFGRSFRPEATLASGFEVKQLSGDWFRLRPTDKFSGLAPGQVCKVDLVSSDWLVHHTDAPNGFYMVFEREPDKGYPLPLPVVKGPADPRKLLRSPDDKKMPVTPADIYNQNLAIGAPETDKMCPVFPTPMKWNPLGSGVVIGQNTPVWIDPAFFYEGRLLKESWQYWFGGINLSGVDVSGGVAVAVRPSPEALPDEAYRMNITPEHGVEIWASTPAGAFYGIQSLSTIIDPAALQQSVAEMRLPCLEIYDRPRFAYRGLHVDVARNFQSKSEILKLLDVMALYKLNTLHFHFSDDEGWRIE
ncbi:MAG TPA: family 20 glycosylhydrolase, partial [Saprospiraceae bacterium]|nr:family 20 glycosylhydrolase [Saprospiraceae bacterium]